MQRFRSLKTLQKFSSVHSQVHNQFNQERQLVTRQAYKQRRSLHWRSGGRLWRRQPLARGRVGHPQATAVALTRPWQLGAVIFLFSRFPSRHTNSLPLVDHPHSLPAVDVLDHDPLLTPATLARKCVGQLRRAAGHLVRSAEDDLTNRRVEPGQSC